MSDSILKVVNLTKYYPIKSGFLNKVIANRRVVDGVDIEISDGQTVALVGESGCGKTVLLRVLMGIEKPTDGDVYLYGKQYTSMSHYEKQEVHKKVQMIFQDAATSLHPRFSVLESLSEPLLLNGLSDRNVILERVVEILEKVSLDANYLYRTADSLSGGQRQRIVIARALVERPELILADEPISALDVSLQAQVLNLLMDIQDEFHLSMLFVAHDLAVVRQIAEYIYIMYAGHILEAAPSNEIYNNAQHPYTQVLLESAPSISKGISGEGFQLNLKVADAPDPARLPSGCVFHTRCVYADAQCSREIPQRTYITPKHYAYCHKLSCDNICRQGQ